MSASPPVFRLGDQHVAVITGAAQGIGLSIAKQALARGMKVVISDYQADLLAQTVATLKADFGDRVSSLASDVSKLDQVEALAAHTYATFGAAHFVVNNAGVGLGKLSWEHTAADWQWVLGVNLMGVVHGINAFVPRMIAAGNPGVVLNVASMAGVLSAPGMAAYNASKHAVVTLTETMQHEFEMTNAKLRAAVLCPAWVRTNISKSYKHRPSDLKNPSAPLNEFEKMVAGTVDNLVSNARLTPDDIASFVFSELDAGKFYLLPHKKVKDDMRARFDALLAEDPPARSMPR
jgi:NAD(P)-dependent dehydrogenase (short-subunit alcohol dehydrogenase family)